MNLTRTALLWGAIAVFGATFSVAAEGDAPLPERREAAQKLMQQGNWNEAFQQLEPIVLDPENAGRPLVQDLQNSISCLNRLGKFSELDGLLESAVEVHGKDWRLLQAAAQHYLNGQHQGFLISGEFVRGPHRGGGKPMQSLERDRVRSLQLFQQAVPLTRDEEIKDDVSDFYLALANALLYNRGYSEAWRLQYLTDLAELPDYEEGYQTYRNYQGAPVDADGKPVFHSAPRSWDVAKTDGERWRFAMEQAVENAPKRMNMVRWELAQFTMQQFGVQTMQQGGYGHFFGRRNDADDEGENESGTYALHTLKENETIARLASGVKRFDLPDEFNFIKILQTIAAEPKTGYGEQALNQLASIFSNRRQYPKAADYWRQSIAEYGPGNNEYKKLQLNQIIEAWGQFEPVMTQAAGEGAAIDFRFRNGANVKFQAQAIQVEKLIADIKTYLRNNPERPDWRRLNIENIGYRLVQEGEAQYIGAEVASWDQKLEPRENHFDRRITVQTPLKAAGAYLLTATMQGGNVSKVIVWVADTAIVKKPLDGQNLYFVADAVSGAPVAKAQLDFFGWRQESLGNRKFKVSTAEFVADASEQGVCLPRPEDLQQNFQWLVTAKGAADGQGRFAFFGFRGVWNPRYYDQEYNTVKVYSITDRPVYRPNQTVHYKMWVRHAQYDQEDVSQFAKQSFPFEIYDPKGEKIVTATLTTDEYGGIEGAYELPADATLGQYQLRLQRQGNGKQPPFSGSGSFRVEEYKKPEFEVTIDAPSKPVMLGEKINATIRAKYYFGAPVANATVKYKIERVDYSQDWYPSAPWDWCYGPGYWWFAPDAPWFPGWRNWVGCVMPGPWWRHQQHNPPELVSEQEVEIGPDGVIEVEIDSQIAKELHGNTDHKYTITAEVRDESRRTIVGTGNVLVARKPFKVYTWVDRGYYHVGEIMQAHLLAQTLDNRGVAGKGVLTLYKITYNDKREPIETPVRRWDLDTNDQGKADIQLQAASKGQYRLAYELTDAEEHKIEGGYLFTIIGDGFDGKDYRFNHLELIPDKADYADGDTVKLQLNTNHVDSTVLLFVRPANGVYLPPKVLQLDGKSAIEEIAVTKKDMPNFFVEALTVSGGQIYWETKEIVVPPEKRVLNVAITPSQETYKPGEKAKVKIHVTEFNGENYSGQTVVSIYDKSLDYIAGGGNTTDIRKFFWDWRRQHNSQTESSLARNSGNMVLPNMPGMQNLGVFGGTVAEEMDGANADDMMMADGPAAGFGGGGGGRMMHRSGDMMMAKGAPMAAMAMAPMADGAMEMAAAPMEASANGVTATTAAAGVENVEPALRSNFADTALWVGALQTDSQGMAEVELDMPENLSTWKIMVWGMGHGTRVGSGEAEVITRKNVIVRLQAPRFFVQKDEVVLSANVHNYLDSAKDVTVVLEAPGGLLELLEDATKIVNIPAGGEHRVDWRVKVLQEGTAVVRMKALTDEESDATQVELPCFVHGMLKTESWAGTVRRDDPSSQLTVSVPAERRPEQSRLEIRYSPSLATAMVDALPYLADYPYGCTEQTLNRFLPAVITQKVLIDMNLDLAAIEKKRTNLNAQEIGDDVDRAKQWKRFDRNPIFEEAELKKIISTGVTSLGNMQNGDGGWGWFSGRGEQSYPHTTAVVVHGLQVAAHNDLPLPEGMLDRGIAWLANYQASQNLLLQNADNNVRPGKTRADDLDTLVYMILVDAGKDNVKMRDYLYRDRNDLAVYSKAMFALALHKVDDKEKRDMLRQNVEQYLVQDAENETAYLQLPENNYWWNWYGSDNEANAYYLKLLAQVDPQGVVAPRLVKYLLNNRKHSTYWNSTRDTAVCVEAFADYIRATGEDKPEMTVEIYVDGKLRQEAEITAENLFSFNNKFLLEGDEVETGDHVIEIRRKGAGQVYFNAYLTNFTLEDPIVAAGLEIQVSRKYYKLVPVEKEIKVAGSRGQALDQRVEKFERVEIQSGETLVSGDLVEVELTLESRNDYEYLIFEDMKAAGFEAVDVRSGYTDEGLRAYTEFRDNRVSFFLQRLARGKNSVSYRLRAEIPGKFSALPARGYAMYAPELKTNSNEVKLGVVDAK
ncbi:MG2 domain protein [Lignipirellula cremea]|uniref:MG2 domain protein n=2 Tax=Lignipirellula cremea TaxID=2528010 RepID=A0A518DRI8_9BACT|nr:MG2 domain protein [Lignipirellula cremea]